MVASCQDQDAPVLPEQPAIEIPTGVELDADVLFGVWSGNQAWGDNNSNYFEQKYEISFEDVESGYAVVSHWYTSATSEIPDSLCNVEYSYTFDGKVVELMPSASALSQGASMITAVHTGGNVLQLYSQNSNGVCNICSLNRTGSPAPSVTGVNRTLPMPGDEVVISGRNLQFVDRVFLPTRRGEEEVEFSSGSRQISFIMPEGEFAAGSIRLQATESHQSCFTSPYMFCYNCVFMKEFSEKGTPKPYIGTEFEYSISTLSTLRSNAYISNSASLPNGHSLSGVEYLNPETFLSFFGETPISLPIATGTDDKKGYLRFSSGDRFQYVLDNCDGLISRMTPSSELAIQMDINVSTDGENVWNSGYISYRLNKDQNSLTSAAVANVALWERDNPADFSDGWLTLTIPLTSFKMVSSTANTTIGALISSLKGSNLQSILTFVNYPLDELHPAREMDSFQFCLTNIRLVPYYTPSNLREVEE